MQSFARIEMEVSGMKKMGDQVLSAQIPVLTWWAMATVITRTATTLTMLSILVLGVYFYIRGTTTVGEIVMFMSYAGLLIGKLEQAVHFANRMVMDAPRVAEFFEVLDTEPTVRDRPDAVDPGRLRGLVEFKDVVVFLRRQARRRSPISPSRHCPGKPSRWSARPAPANRPRWRCSIACSTRNPARSRSTAWTFAGSRCRGCAAISAWCSRRCCCSTARSPRTCGSASPMRPTTELRAACERAQVYDVIERLPEGFETSAGERGRLFSGGERQRLSIARALLKDPPILILDEATSALDALTEARVQAALAEVMKGRTTFVIAHRLATIRNASRILVFQGGRIIEAGSFDELMRLGGHFAELAKSQFMAGEAVKARTERASAAPVET